MNEKNAKKARLELDTELIADLEVDAGDIKGGQYTIACGGGGALSIVVSRRGDALVAEAAGGGLNAC